MSSGPGVDGPEDTSPIYESPVMRRRRRAAVFGATACAALSVAGLLATLVVKSPAQVAAEAAPPGRSLLSAQVERRAVAMTLVTRGTVAAAQQVSLASSPSSAAGGVPMVTATFVKTGSAVKAGDVLLEISGRPVIALQGTTPAYRDLRPNDDGKDVVALQAALRKLGHYSGGDRVGTFGPATKAGVERLYRRVGYRVPTTAAQSEGSEEQALAGAAAAVREAQRAVDLLRRSIAAGEQSGDTTPATAPTPAGEEPPELALTYLLDDLKRAKQAESRLIARTGPMVPLAEIVYVPSFPSRVTQVSARVGAPVVPPSVSLAGGRLYVTAKLRPDQEELVKPGMPVEIAAEVLGREATGTVATVGPLTAAETTPTEGEQQTGGQGAAYVPVTIETSKPLAQAWLQQDVRLTITAAKTSEPVLVVPLSAVSAGADGRPFVSKVRDDGSVARVEVEVGVSGDGFVAVTPADGDLSEGDRVVVGSAEAGG